MFTVAVWFWLSFNNAPQIPDHVFLHVYPDGTCKSEERVYPDVDCEHTHLTVATPSDDGKRIELSRLKIVCVAGKDRAATISVVCSK